jgi:hypothetical protein
MIRPWLITHPARLQQSSNLFDWPFPEGTCSFRITVIFMAGSCATPHCCPSLPTVNIIVDNWRTRHIKCALPMFGHVRPLQAASSVLSWYGWKCSAFQNRCFLTATIYIHISVDPICLQNSDFREKKRWSPAPTPESETKLVSNLPGRVPMLCSITSKAIPE